MLSPIQEASIASEWRGMQTGVAVPGAESKWLMNAQTYKDPFTVSSKTSWKREQRIHVRARREEEVLYSHLLGWALSLQRQSQHLQIPELSLLNNGPGDSGHGRRRDCRASAFHC